MSKWAEREMMFWYWVEAGDRSRIWYALGAMLRAIGDRGTND